jgi:L-asparaginase II
MVPARRQLEAERSKASRRLVYAAAHIDDNVIQDSRVCGHMNLHPGNAAGDNQGSRSTGCAARHSGHISEVDKRVPTLI